MKNITIRIDDDFEQQLRKKAAQKNIKVTRYIRSLIDRGLAMETQLELVGLGDIELKNREAFHTRLAEMLAEILIYSKQLIKINPELKNSAEPIIVDAQTRSQNYVAKIKLGDNKL